MKKIQIEGTPTPKGHYSQGIVHNGLVYVSGQLPMDMVTGEPLLGDIEAQTEAALLNVESVLKAAGSDLSQVIQMTIYISDGDYWAKVNEVYARVMGDHRPARAIVPVKDLHFGLGIEIQAIAAVKD
jgi:reactive intermediate/imine deaminase